jgi:hypothetical protein
MAFNGYLKKQGILAILAGGITGILLFTTVLTLYHSFNTLPYVPPVEETIGSKIAEDMEKKESNITYVWIFNNTWVNINISEHYQRFIDGILIGDINGTFSMALLNEPNAHIAPINRSELNKVMSIFRDSISTLNNVSENVTALNDVFPPSFLMDIAYEDGTAFSLAFSVEKSAISFIQGIWVQTEYYFRGVRIIDLSYNIHNAEFLDFTYSDSIFNGLDSLEELIFSIFPS